MRDMTRRSSIISNIISPGGHHMSTIHSLEPKGDQDKIGQKCMIIVVHLSHDYLLRLPLFLSLQSTGNISLTVTQL